MSEPVIYVSDVGGDGDYYLASIPVLMGCIASGKTREQAIANARRSFRLNIELLETRGVSVEHWRALDPSRFTVTDMPANGLLPEDQRPLEEHELRDFLHIFEAHRAALIALVQGMTQAELERAPDEQTWSVRQTLDHIMTSDALILSRLE